MEPQVYSATLRQTVTAYINDFNVTEQLELEHDLGLTVVGSIKLDQQKWADAVSKVTEHRRSLSLLVNLRQVRDEYVRAFVAQLCKQQCKKPVLGAASRETLRTWLAVALTQVTVLGVAHLLTHHAHIHQCQCQLCRVFTACPKTCFSLVCGKGCW